MINLEKFKSLIGEELTVIELSNYLTDLGCEDICEFGNWSDLLEDGDVVVATDEFGDENIHIFFETTILANDDSKDITDSYIKILNVEEF